MEKVKSVIDLSDISGVENVKRAMEVARTGNHSIVVVGYDRDYYQLLRNAFDEFPTEIKFLSSTETCVPWAWYMDACACGKRTDCICSKEDIIAHNAEYRKDVRSTDMSVKMGEVSFKQLVANRLDESSQIVFDRIRLAQRFLAENPPITTLQEMRQLYDSLGPSSKALLSAGFTKLNLPPLRIIRVLNIARTIRALDFSSKHKPAFGIEAMHIAEAISYSDHPLMT